MVTPESLVTGGPESLVTGGLESLVTGGLGATPMCGPVTVTVTETSTLTPDHLTVTHKTITGSDGRVEVSTVTRAEGSGEIRPITTSKDDPKCKKLSAIWVGAYVTGGYLDLSFCKGIDANRRPGSVHVCTTLAELLVSISIGGCSNTISACKEVAPLPITMIQTAGVLGLGIASTFAAYGCHTLGGATFASKCTELTNHLIPVTASVVSTLIQ